MHVGLPRLDAMRRVIIKKHWPNDYYYDFSASCTRITKLCERFQLTFES